MDAPSPVLMKELRFGGRSVQRRPRVWDKSGPLPASGFGPAAEAG